MVGPCASRVVRATIVALNGDVYEGENTCANPQKVCPRLGLTTGVGYHLCRSVCQQTGHAEINAIRAAGKAARGSILYLRGHTYACEPCQQAAREAGVIEIVITE